MDSKNDLKPGSETGDDAAEKNPEVEVVYNPLASQARGGRKDYSTQLYQKDDETSRKVIELARLGLSKTAVALASRLSPMELTKWYNDEYLAGQAGMQEVVARGLMEQAMAGNPQILMYLGKSKLGWTESNTVEHIGTVNAVVSARPLTKEEFEAKYLASDGDKDEET
jgi:hypothetical protein